MSVHIFGIRHHGPGSGRHTLNALNEVRPDIILIEGPPEGEALLHWAAHKEMQPPVALLAFVPDEPQKAVFYPFSAYSAEWQSIQYGLAHGIPIRFMDMPLVHKLAQQPEEPAPEAAADLPAAPGEVVVRKSPIAHLAEIAGFEDAEAWWEQHFEQAQHASEVFGTIRNAMQALRESFPDTDPMEQLREAFMRKAIRTAVGEMYASIAVVCGAWHAPALEAAETYRKADEQAMKHLPKTTVEATWIPWTNDRLMQESGYGAGITSPGWYEHNWDHPDDDGTQWLTRTAHAFRNAQKDISSAHVIESVRLANALAQLRNIQKPGLSELWESTRTVMCMGDDAPMTLLKTELVVGNRLGTVPDGIPRSPLQKDFEDQLRSLRLKIQESAQNLQLDLRKPNDLAKSHLLHRLRLLDVEWGQLANAKGKGTYKEEWNLYWRPEMMIQLAEKANWGNTLESASNRLVSHIAAESQQLGEVVETLQKALLADLQGAITALIGQMDRLAASTSDITALMRSFPPLAELYQYGSVRNSDQTMIGGIMVSVFYRILASLPPACGGIDEKQSAEMAELISKVHGAVRLLAQNDLSEAWAGGLKAVLGSQQSAPFVQGVCCKLLYDTQQLTPATTAEHFGYALSPSQPPGTAAQWMEGFLSHSATVLLLDEPIWNLVYQWMVELEEDVFYTLLPIIRRTFSAYAPAEKRKIAQKVKAGTGAADTNAFVGGQLDFTSAKRVLPTLELLLLPKPTDTHA